MTLVCMAMALSHLNNTYTIHYCTIQTAHCTVQAAHCKLHTAHCTLPTLHCQLYTFQSANCKLNIVDSKLHIELSTLHTAHSTLHSIHCPLPTLYVVDLYSYFFLHLSSTKDSAWCEYNKQIMGIKRRGTLVGSIFSGFT